MSEVIDKDAYRTPFPLFYFAARMAGGMFHYDTACTSRNKLAKPIWELPGFKRGDALSKKWPDGKIIFCNPPYSNIDPWVGSMTQTNSTVALLIPPSNGERRYAWLHEMCFEVNLIGRVSFRHPTRNTVVKGNRGGSSLFFCNHPKAGQRETISLADAFMAGNLYAEKFLS